MPRGTGRYDEAQLQRRLWTPRELPNGTIGCWLDANGKLTSAANAVSAWSDISPQGFNDFAQGTAGNKPTLVPATGPNGLAAINFDGGDLMVATSGFTYDSSLGWTSYVVAENDGSATERTIHACHNSAGAYQMRFDSAHTVTLLRSQQLGLITSDVTTATGAFHIVGGSVKLNFEAVSVNGTEKTGTTNPAFTAVMNTLASNNGGELMTGRIGEFVFCVTMLEAWVRRRLEGYLAWRWGLQGNLPGDHVYKNRPPVI